MNIVIHSHAKERMVERGINETEVEQTIRKGEVFPAKYGRTGFRLNFPFNDIRKEKEYKIKQVEVYAVKEEGNWIVVTVISKFF